MHMPDTHEPSGEDVAVLTKRLEERRAALLEIPGVTGCGVGLTQDGGGSPVIQVFVAHSSHVAGVRQAVSPVRPPVGGRPNQQS